MVNLVAADWPRRFAPYEVSRLAILQEKTLTVLDGIKELPPAKNRRQRVRVSSKVKVSLANKKRDLRADGLTKDVQCLWTPGGGAGGLRNG